MLISKLRTYIAKNNIDYLLVNTCDEFLLEYNALVNCPRYLLTGFSGSAGEALLTKNKIYLFVDGRYHEQAEKEVDKNIIEVVKLQNNQNYITEISKILKSNTTFAFVSKKIPFSHYKFFKKLLSKKNIKFKKILNDPVFEYVDYVESEKEEVFQILLKDKIKERFLKITADLKDNENLFISSLEEIAYLLNLRSYSLPFCSTFKAKMLVSKTEIKLFSDCNFKNVNLPNYVKIFPLNNFETHMQKDIIYIYSPKTINVYNYDLIRKNSKIKSKSILSELKSQKTKNELKHIKECYKRTDIVLNKVRNLVSSDEKFTELQLANFIQDEFKKQGAKSLSFSSIVAFGKNSSIIHYSKYDKNKYIENGDMVLVDCGAYFENGYATDITRTFFRGDKPSDLQKRVYTYVLKAFLNAISYSSKNNFTGFKLDKIARNIIDDKIEGFSFSHSLGHGVGISVHESPPSISSGKLGKSIIKENMVFTIEPGLYKPNEFGVRLENSVYLEKTDDKYLIKSLSNVPFEKKLIDFSLLTKKEKIYLNKFLYN